MCKDCKDCLYGTYSETLIYVLYRKPLQPLQVWERNPPKPITHTPRTDFSVMLTVMAGEIAGKRPAWR